MLAALLRQLALEILPENDVGHFVCCRAAEIVSELWAELREGGGEKRDLFIKHGKFGFCTKKRGLDFKGYIRVGWKRPANDAGSFLSVMCSLSPQIFPYPPYDYIFRYYGYGH